MIKYKIILLLFTCNLINAQITFEKTYGGIGQEFAASFCQTIDNGYILLGSSESFTNSSDLYLIKTDTCGNIIWSNTYGGVNFDSGHDLKETNDSGFIMTGMVNLQTQVYKTNKTGNIKWTKTYPGAYPLRVIQLQDSSYAICGNIQITGSNWDMMLIKTDTVGNIMWSKNYGYNTWDDFGDAKQTNDGGYILAGSRTINWMQDIYVVKTNSVGDTLWTKSYGGTLEDFSYSIVQTSDNGFIILGATGSDPNYKPYLIKTDQNGDTLWTKKFNYGCSNNGGNKIIQTPDGGYVFVGETNQNTPAYEIYIVKTNSQGDSLWTKTFKNGFAMDIKFTNDGGFAIFGFTQYAGAGMNDFYFAKTNNEGVIIGIKEQLNDNLNLKIFPNPAKNSITISQTEPTFNKYEIYSLNGKLVAENKITNILQKVDLSAYSEGMYIVKLIGDQKVAFKKIVVIE